MWGACKSSYKSTYKYTYNLTYKYLEVCRMGKGTCGRGNAKGALVFPWFFVGFRPGR